MLNFSLKHARRVWHMGERQFKVHFKLDFRLNFSLKHARRVWHMGDRPEAYSWLLSDICKKGLMIFLGGRCTKYKFKVKHEIARFTHSCWGNWPLDWPDLCYQHTLGQFPISISCSVYSESSGVKDHSFLQHTTWSFQFSTIKWNLASFLTLHNPGPSTIAEVAEPWSIHWKEMKNIFSVVDAV